MQGICIYTNSNCCTCTRASRNVHFHIYTWTLYNVQSTCTCVHNVCLNFSALVERYHLFASPHRRWSREAELTRQTRPCLPVRPTASSLAVGAGERRGGRGEEVRREESGRRSRQMVREERRGRRNLKDDLRSPQFPHCV